MSQSSLTRKIARLTRRFRASLGLATLEAGPAGSVPFRRSLPKGRQAAARVEAIESDLNRLILGWNQHLPQILGVVGEARQIAQREQTSQGEIAELRALVSHLDARVAELEQRLNPFADSAPPGRAPAGEAEPAERPSSPPKLRRAAAERRN